jgi:hypothetical protein
MPIYLIHDPSKNFAKVITAGARRHRVAGARARVGGPRARGAATVAAAEAVTGGGMAGGGWKGSSSDCRLARLVG